MLTHCPADNCNRPTHPGWVICRPCATGLERALAEIPALQAELDTQTARQASRDHGPVATAAERPLPYDVRAAESTWVLRNALVSWIRDLEPDTERHPADTLPAMARWLLARISQLWVHPAGDEAVSELRDAIAQAWRCVDNPPERVFLGVCDCTAELWAAMDASRVRCRGCETEHDPADLKDGLLSKVAGHLVTAQEFSGYAVRYLGVPVRGQERLEASVRTWASRGRVEAVGHVSRHDGPPQPTYRFGDLAARLADRERSAG